jgi:hypothetical protein
MGGHTGFEVPDLVVCRVRRHIDINRGLLDHQRRATDGPKARMCMLATDLSMFGRHRPPFPPDSPDLPGSCLQRVEVDQLKVLCIVNFS